MKIGQLACFVGVLGISGCSGKVDIGVSVDGGSGGMPSAGMSSGAGLPGVGGAPASGGMSSAGGGEADGGGGAPVGPFYCGNQVVMDGDIPFASPAVVAARIEKFLFVQKTMPGLRDGIPTVTTREWAGDYAISLLTNDASAPLATAGMVAFIDNWWPGVSDKLTWANYFTLTPGKLSDLFTSPGTAPNGAGLLTDGSIYTDDDISLRGVALRTRLYCTQVPPPPPNMSHLPEPAPGVSHREQLEQSTNAAACRACHSLFDGLGFSVQNFANDGSFRTTDNGAPIDTSGQFIAPPGSPLVFADLHDLAAQLGQDCSVATCVTQKMQETAIVNASLPPDRFSPDVLNSVAYQFALSGYDLRTLVRALVQSNAFLKP